MGMRRAPRGGIRRPAADQIGYASAARRVSMTLNLDGLQVVVTGGTGALGTAVVGRLLEAGAVCHVPWVHAKELERFPHKGKAQLIEGVELTDEKAVEGLYARFSGD